MGDIIQMKLAEVIKLLKQASHPEYLAGMSRYGIRTDRAFGIKLPDIRAIAKKIGKDHSLAQELWATGFHEARFLAAFIDQPKEVTEIQMEEWVRDFDSWDICDQTCGNLFDRTPYAFEKVVEWSSAGEEFVKRAAFALMAALAVHAKKIPDHEFLMFLPIIEREAGDDRNFVKKAVNWALRQTGKRSISLHQEALKTAYRIKEQPSRNARWIAGDTIRELENSTIISRIRR
jgi:3-methyladenine DNA glycosylase AlkD